MATLTEKTYRSQPESAGDGITLPALARTILRPLASLKLTVALFAMGIFIIWVSTLAQAEKDIWQVVHDYFWRPIWSPFAFIELQFLFPFQWLPFKVNIPRYLGFPFPGGSMIGVAMAVNLLAAHLVRFKIQAKGMAMLWGTLIAMAGCGLTLLVIVSGHNSEGLQAKPPFEWTQLWFYSKLGLIVGGAGLGYLLTRIDHKSQAIMSWVAIVATSTYGVLLIGLFTIWRAWYPGDPAMRIMWQLIQGGLAGVVILIGCLFLFKKRAGIVVIHLAVGLLLIGESFVSLYNVEETMNIVEGESSNYAVDIRETELAVVSPSAQGAEQHVVVPESMILPTPNDKTPAVSHEQLPFDVEVVEYFKNSDVRPVKPSDDNPATAGLGLKFFGFHKEPGTGTDTGGKVDVASAYVRLIDKQTDDPLGTYLVSQLYSGGNLITVGGEVYDLTLRFKRAYKPYTIHLEDVQKNDYVGSMTPKDFRSYIKLDDPTKGVSQREMVVWMNNPVRYAGETFYQSSFNSMGGGREMTSLQVVTNTGWMIPYVACMMALVGMAYHFMLTLVRFTNRVSAKQHAEPTAWWGKYLIGATVIAGLALMASVFRPESTTSNEMDLLAFGKLPVAHDGRIKPLDTLARNHLQAISDRQSFVDEEGEKQPAIRWLLDLVAKPETNEKQKVFRIRNPQVVELLGLKDTDDDRYALADFYDKLKEVDEHLSKAREAQRAETTLTAFQKGLLTLHERVITYRLLTDSMRPVPLPPMPSEEEMKSEPSTLAMMEREVELLSRIVKARGQQLANVDQNSPMNSPKSVYNPEEQDWETYAQAWDQSQAYMRIPFVRPDLKPPEVPQSTVAFHEIFAAYEKNNVKQFNTALANYQQQIKQLESTAPESELDMARLRFESFFNQAQPFTTAIVIYLIAFVLALVGLLTTKREIAWSAFGLIIVGLVLHTLALAARVYISERPPVTNLYSSAVFIGWGGVVLCLIIEAIYRNGIGNVVATVAGVSTLIIANILGIEGDTFKVLLAVLDTNFWLTTHVICVTLGYATTFVAGLLGVVYLIGRVVPSQFIHHMGKDIIRMCYGVVCFAIFFSFLGTVLGGLWADDSWGRFWGWDPKENGALIIVLWNALILHARWGGMVRDRGLATLAVAGNIVTSWSWFGVNQLGIGLHSYGFTKGVVVALTLFVISQMIVMMLAIVPSQPVEAKWVKR